MNPARETIKLPDLTRFLSQNNVIETVAFDLHVEIYASDAHLALGAPNDQRCAVETM